MKNLPISHDETTVLDLGLFMLLILKPEMTAICLLFRTYVSP